MPSEHVAEIIYMYCLQDLCYFFYEHRFWNLNSIMKRLKIKSVDKRGTSGWYIFIFLVCSLVLTDITELEMIRMLSNRTVSIGKWIFAPVIIRDSKTPISFSNWCLIYISRNAQQKPTKTRTSSKYLSCYFGFNSRM